MFHAVVLFLGFRVWSGGIIIPNGRDGNIDNKEWLFDYKIQKTKVIFSISYQGDRLMIAERKRIVCVRICARGYY